jgi:hypothetical protein
MKLHRPIALASLLFLGVAQIAQAQLPDHQQLLAMRQQMAQPDDRNFAEFFQKHDIATDRLPDTKLRTVLDKLCQQRDCHASQLYWHTDLEQAKAAAQKTGKPILSLRLLGNLDEEMSCANSRFFRVALYANRDIAKTLRDRYILHWSSERPVPKLTVDFGDGRKLERTVTGNSIHYILDVDGNPIEALPGLYSPQAFLSQLQQIDQAFQAYQTVSEPLAKDGFWRNYYRDRLTKLQTKWQQALQQVGVKEAPKLLDVPRTDAVTAGQLAMTKSAIELPFVRPMRAISSNQQQLTQITDEASWRKLATRVDSRLDANSLALMKAKVAPQAKDNFAKTVQQFEQNMALDTVRNEYLLHGKIYQWLLADRRHNFASLNQRVYSELFLTPASDAWLGLNPADAFAAIEQDGQIFAF